eukprot:08982.XXX_102094_102303_1 [CDS] Oithona nana genome sequencing.
MAYFSSSSCKKTYAATSDKSLFLVLLGSLSIHGLEAVIFSQAEAGRRFCRGCFYSCSRGLEILAFLQIP